MSGSKPTIEELRAQWEALEKADTLFMLPKEALIASIKDLAKELLDRTAAEITSYGDSEKKFLEEERK